MMSRPLAEYAPCCTVSITRDRMNDATSVYIICFKSKYEREANKIIASQNNKTFPEDRPYFIWQILAIISVPPEVPL